MCGQVLEYLVIYAVSFHSKGCIFSLGLCYNLIPVLVQRQLGKSSLEENKRLLIRHLTQVRPCCCWQLRRGWFHLTKEREPLGRLTIKKILSVPLCRFTYPNVPILGFPHFLSQNLDFVPETYWGCAVGLLCSSTALISISCEWFSAIAFPLTAEEKPYILAWTLQKKHFLQRMSQSW